MENTNLIGSGIDLSKLTKAEKALYSAGVKEFQNPSGLLTGLKDVGSIVADKARSFLEMLANGGNSTSKGLKNLTEELGKMK